jgi:hypothetical protein
MQQCLPQKTNQKNQKKKKNAHRLSSELAIPPAVFSPRPLGIVPRTSTPHFCLCSTYDWPNSIEIANLSLSLSLSRSSPVHFPPLLIIWE